MSRLALVVDDSALVRYSLRLCLERRGYEVACASDGLEALELLKLKRLALIVTSLHVPKISGQDLILTAKKLPETAGVPVIVLVRRGTSPVAVPGSDCVIHKGIDLIEQLRRALGKLEVMKKPA